MNGIMGNTIRIPVGWNSLLCGVCADTSHACCVAVPEGTEPASAGGEDQCRIKRRRSL